MAQTVSEYYATNYTNCIVDDSFLGSWQGLAYTSHLTQFFALPIQILTFYLIIKKTPLSMKCVKKPLLVSHSLCSLMDFGLGTLSTPYIFFPECAMFGVGLLDWLQVPFLPLFIFGMFLCFAAGISLVYLFEVRSSSIQNNIFKITKNSTRVKYYGANAFLCLLLSLVLLKHPEDQETAKLEVLKTMPCPTREFFNQATYVILSDPFWTHFVSFFALPGIALVIGSQLLFYLLCCIHYLYIAPSKTTSSSTRRLQSSFFIGIVIQIGVPSVVVVLTYAIMIISFLTGNHTQGIMNMCMVIFGIHGISESISIIMVHGSYRRVIWKFLKKPINSKKEVQILAARRDAPSRINNSFMNSSFH